MLERAIAKGAFLPVCPSVRHNRDPDLNGLRFKKIECDRAMFLVSSTFLTSDYIVLSLGVRHKCVKEKYTPQSENVTSRPNLGNGTR